MKQYKFNLTARRTEVYDGGYAVVYGKGGTVATGSFTGTLSDALLALARFSSATAAPHEASLTVDASEPRAPAGFNKASTRIARSA